MSDSNITVLFFKIKILIANLGVLRNDKFKLKKNLLQNNITFKYRFISLITIIIL
jgi:hypothetical protein